MTHVIFLYHSTLAPACWFLMCWELQVTLHSEGCHLLGGPTFSVKVSTLELTAKKMDENGRWNWDDLFSEAFAVSFQGGYIPPFPTNPPTHGWDSQRCISRSPACLCGGRKVLWRLTFLKNTLESMSRPQATSQKFMYIYVYILM